jgi:hypothetical protein
MSTPALGFTRIRKRRTEPATHESESDWGQCERATRLHVGAELSLGSGSTTSRPRALNPATMRRSVAAVRVARRRRSPVA